MTTALPLPPLAAFKTWLEAQPRTRFVGCRMDCQGCALAKWLQTVFETLVRVDEASIEVDDAQPTALHLYETPEDYIRVIQAIDYGTYSFGMGRKVTVCECLTILKDVLEDEKDI